MTLTTLRATLAIITLAAVIMFGVLIFYFTLTPVQQAVLTMIVTALIGKLSTAFSYIFDGVPEKTNKESL